MPSANLKFLIFGNSYILNLFFITIGSLFTNPVERGKHISRNNYVQPLMLNYFILENLGKVT